MTWVTHNIPSVPTDEDASHACVAPAVHYVATSGEKDCVPTTGQSTSMERSGQMNAFHRRNQMTHKQKIRQEILTHLRENFPDWDWSFQEKVLMYFGELGDFCLVVSLTGAPYGTWEFEQAKCHLCCKLDLIVGPIEAISPRRAIEYVLHTWEKAFLAAPLWEEPREDMIRRHKEELNDH